MRRLTESPIRPQASRDIIKRLEADAEACEDAAEQGASEWAITAKNIREVAELVKQYREAERAPRTQWVKVSLMWALIVFAPVLAAAPFLVSDALPPEVTHCGLRVDQAAVVDFPAVPDSSGKVCVVDLLDLPIAGTYVVTLTAVIAGPPRTESPLSAKFHIKETTQTKSARVQWQGWTNLFCPDTGAACYWQ